MADSADDGAVFTPQMLEQAADPSLPAGAIAIQDGEGNWWRYPLCEFTEAGDD
jgi:hypothetical protein